MRNRSHRKHAATRTGLEEAIASGFGVTERERVRVVEERRALKIRNVGKGIFAILLGIFEIL